MHIGNLLSVSYMGLFSVNFFCPLILQFLKLEFVFINYLIRVEFCFYIANIKVAYLVSYDLFMVL